MDLPPPPHNADFIAPARETKKDHARFSLAEMRYNVRLSTAKRNHAAELRAKGTPLRDGFAKIFELIS